MKTKIFRANLKLQTETTFLENNLFQEHLTKCLQCCACPFFGTPPDLNSTGFQAAEPSFPPQLFKICTFCITYGVDTGNCSIHCGFLPTIHDHGDSWHVGAILKMHLYSIQYRGHWTACTFRQMLSVFNHCLFCMWLQDSKTGLYWGHFPKGRFFKISN